MPKVPRVTETSVGYDVVRGGVTPSPGPSIGGQLAEAGTKVASFVERVQEEENQKVDRTKLLEARTQALKIENDLLFNPQTGAMNKRGKDTFGLPDKVLPQWQQRMAEIEGGFTSDEQRQEWAHIRGEREVSISRSLGVHEASERDKYYGDTEATAIAEAKDHAFRNAANPEQVQYAIHMGLEGLQSKWERTGADQSVIDHEREEFIAQTHAGVMTAIADNVGANAAEKYLNEHRAEISLDAKSLAASEDFIKSAKQKEEADARQRVIHARQDREWAEYNAYETASRAVELAGNDLSVIPPSQFMALPKKYRDSIRAQTLETRAIDWNRYSELVSMAAEGDKKLLDINIANEVAALGGDKTILKEIVGFQADMRKGALDQAKVKSTQTDMSAINSFLAPLYPEKDKAGSDDQAANSAAVLRARKLIDENRDENGNIEWAKRDNLIAGVYAEEFKRRKELTNLWVNRTLDDPKITGKAWTMEDDDFNDDELLPDHAISIEFAARANRIAAQYGNRELLPMEMRQLATRYAMNPSDSDLDMAIRAKVSE